MPDAELKLTESGTVSEKWQPGSEYINIGVDKVGSLQAHNQSIITVSRSSLTDRERPVQVEYCYKSDGGVSIFSR